MVQFSKAESGYDGGGGFLKCFDVVFGGGGGGIVRKGFAIILFSKDGVECMGSVDAVARSVEWT
jgi:hypothetical protein